MFSVLKECFEDSSQSLSSEIKVSAVEAHRKFVSCERLRNQYFMKIYKNFTVETEVRIASYLQIMRCPDYNVINTIRQVLELEEVNQGKSSYIL